MCAEKVKIRAAVWIGGRQRQKVKYQPLGTSIFFTSMGMNQVYGCPEVCCEVC